MLCIYFLVKIKLLLIISSWNFSLFVKRLVLTKEFSNNFHILTQNLNYKFQKAELFIFSCLIGALGDIFVGLEYRSNMRQRRPITFLRLAPARYDRIRSQTSFSRQRPRLRLQVIHK